MNKVELSEISLEENAFDYGDESTIYKLKNRDSLYKAWLSKKDIERNNLKSEKIRNKVRKLESINEKKDIFSFIVKPEELVTMEDTYTGYQMEYFDGEKLDKYLKYKDTVILLKKLRETLLKLYNKDVKCFDLNYSNILYRKENEELIFKIIDIDNMMVDDLSMDLYPPFIAKYLYEGGKLDEKAIIYAHNYLSITLLSMYDSRLSPNPYIPTYNRRLAKFSELIDRPKVDSLIDNEYIIDSYNENDNLTKVLI